MPWHSWGLVLWDKAPFPCKAGAGAVLPVPHTHLGMVFPPSITVLVLHLLAQILIVQGQVQSLEQPRVSECWESRGSCRALGILQCPQTPGEGEYVSCSCSFALCQEHSGDGAAQPSCWVESECALCSLPARQTCCHCFTPSSGNGFIFSRASLCPCPLYVSYILNPVIDCTLLPSVTN